MQTSGYADADRIRTKNNMSPPSPMVGGGGGRIKYTKKKKKKKKKKDKRNNDKRTPDFIPRRLSSFSLLQNAQAFL